MTDEEERSTAEEQKIIGCRSSGRTWAESATSALFYLERGKEDEKSGNCHGK